MKAVVFGGSGFLGSHVADVLTERGYEVTIFDLRPSPHAKPRQQMVIGNRSNGSHFTYHRVGTVNPPERRTAHPTNKKAQVFQPGLFCIGLDGEF